jgi:hypothetical protein
MVSVYMVLHLPLYTKWKNDIMCTHNITGQ